MFGIEFWIVTTDFVGKIMIAVMALMVHWRIRKEKKIDLRVLGEFKIEYIVGIISILLLIISYVLSMIS